MSAISSMPRESWLRRAWDAFTEWFQSPARTDFYPTAGAPIPPPVINAEAVAKNMKLVKRGIRDGQRESPPTEAQGFGEMEMRIANFIELERAKWQAYIQYWVDRKGSALQELTERMLAGNYIARAEIASNTGIADLRTQKEVADQELTVLRDEVDDENENCERLRRLMNIQGAPRNIPSVALHWVILVIIGLTEAVLNGTFLGLRSTGGLIEGLSTASGIALINMIFGFVLGRWTWVNLRHWKLWVKLLNIAVLVLIVLLIAGLNLGVGHYRDILDESVRGTGDWMTATREAFDRFSTDLFGIQDLMSWGLVGIGCLCALLAVIGAHMMVDPHPGYGAAAKALSGAQARLDERVKNYSEELLEILRRTMSELQDLARVASDPMLVYRQVRDIEESLQRFGSEDIEARRRLQQLGQDLLSTYRNENMANRETPPPRHWRQPFQLNEGVPPFVPPAPVGQPTPDINAEQFIGDYVNRVQEAHQKALQSIRLAGNTVIEARSQGEQDE